MGRNAADEAAGGCWGLLSKRGGKTGFDPRPKGKEEGPPSVGGGGDGGRTGENNREMGLIIFHIMGLV